MYRFQGSPLKEKLLLLLASATLCLFAGAGALAHQLGQGYIFLGVYDEKLNVRVEITEADLTKALGVLVDSSTESLDSVVVAKIKTYVEEHLEIKADNPGISLRFTHHSTRSIEVADYVLLHFKMEGFTQRPRRLEIHYSVLFETDPQHRGLLVIQHNWKTGTLMNEKVPPSGLQSGSGRGMS